MRDVEHDFKRFDYQNESKSNKNNNNNNCRSVYLQECFGAMARAFIVVLMQFTKQRNSKRSFVGTGEENRETKLKPLVKTPNSYLPEKMK